MFRVRDVWTHRDPPNYCSGCGNALFTEIIEDATSPRYDRMTGLELSIKNIRVAYCKEGKARDEKDRYLVSDSGYDRVMHDNWMIPEQ